MILTSAPVFVLEKATMPRRYTDTATHRHTKRIMFDLQVGLYQSWSRTDMLPTWIC